MTNSIEPAAIADTHRVIGPFLRRTPIVETDGADFGSAGRLVMKLEYLQHTGSFKARGAFANLLLRELPKVGVVAASGGNHGTAVAYAAMKRGVPANIFVPTVCSVAKIERIKSYGANLVVTGDRYGDAFKASEAWRAESGALPIHAFDQVETLLGQGTLGREIDEQTEIDTLIVAVGGAGLIAGIASWFEGRVKIVAVEPEEAPTLTRAMAAGGPADAPAGGIAADSLGPFRIGEMTYPIVKKYVNEVILVSDDDIAATQKMLWDRMRIVAEPGGATALSSLVSGRYKPAADERVGVLVCGANTTAVNF